MISIKIYSNKLFMKNKGCISRLHIATFLTFFAILMFFVYFTAVAPGSYQFDTQSKNVQSTLLDAVLALIITANCACTFCSLLDALKTGHSVLKHKCLHLRQLFQMLMGIYPTLLLLCICSWDCALLANYILSPVRMLCKMFKL